MSAHIIGGINVILPCAVLIGDGNAEVLLPESGVLIVLQAAEHGLVAHPVSVDKRVEAAESWVCPVVQKQR